MSVARGLKEKDEPSVPEYQKLQKEVTEVAKLAGREKSSTSRRLVQVKQKMQKKRRGYGKDASTLPGLAGEGG